MADPASYLVQGTNVLAVHLVNRNLAGSDLCFDCALADPFGPDTTRPALASRVPAEPFWSCGNDATSDSLTCESFTGCGR